MNFQDKLNDFKNQLISDKILIKFQEINDGQILPSDKKMVQLNINITKDLRSKLKIIAAKNETDLKKLVTDLLIQYVGRYENR